MKRITFEQLILASKKLGSNTFMAQVTSAKYPLQTAHTEQFYVNNLLAEKDYKQDRLIRIMARYSTLFKKAWLYVSDEIYIKYF